MKRSIKLIMAALFALIGFQNYNAILKIMPSTASILKGNNRAYLMGFEIGIHLTTIACIAISIAFLVSFFKTKRVFKKSTLLILGIISTVVATLDFIQVYKIISTISPIGKESIAYICGFNIGAYGINAIVILCGIGLLIGFIKMQFTKDNKKQTII